LRFIRGVIDSEDLPLNISREMLQNNPQLAQIRKAVTGRVVGELESLGEREPEAFAKIWDAFGAVIKEGIWEDYRAAREAAGAVALHDHRGESARCSNIAETQAEPDRDLLSGRRQHRAAEIQSRSWNRLRRAASRCCCLPTPSTRSGRRAARFRRQAAEVAEPGRRRLQPDSADRRKGEQGKESPAADEAMTIAVIKEALGERVVRRARLAAADLECLLSRRLPARHATVRWSVCSPEHDKGAAKKPILEINLQHPLVAAVAQAKDAAKDLSLLLLEQAQILDGELPEDPAGFAGRLNQLVLRGLKS
jgi:molecular chaperone HtpG